VIGVLPSVAASRLFLWDASRDWCAAFCRRFAA
jgi:hypothetical protein